MSREKPNEFLRVRVTSRTRAVVADWSEKTGMTKERLVGALVDHWATQDERVRLQTLIKMSDDDVMALSVEIAAKRDKDMAAGVAMMQGAIADAAASEKPAPAAPPQAPKKVER